MEPKESMEIIQSMIETSKRKIGSRSPYFLLWGWTVFLTALAQYILLKLYYPHTYYVWMTMILAGIASMIMGIREKKTQKVETYTGDAVKKLWQSLGIAFVLCAWLSIKGSIPSIPTFLMLYGIGILTTGRIIQFKPLIFGGIACFIISLVSTMMENGIDQLLLLALAVLLSYIIPGHVLRSEFNKER